MLLHLALDHRRAAPRHHPAGGPAGVYHDPLLLDVLRHAGRAVVALLRQLGRSRFLYRGLGIAVDRWHAGDRR